jgi:hypothetical protein
MNSMQRTTKNVVKTHLRQSWLSFSPGNARHHSDPLFPQPSAIKSIKMRPPHGDHDESVVSTLPGAEKMGFVTLSHDVEGILSQISTQFLDSDDFEEAGARR